MADKSLSADARCDELIQSLTDEERARLTRFAERRLGHFGLRDREPKELFHQAICSVLRGLSGDGGRRPNPRDMAGRDSGLNYLRGAINSVAEGWACTFYSEDENNCSLDALPEFLPAAADTLKSVEYADFVAELFKRLRQRAPARLLPTIDAWEKPPDGRIPIVTSRKHTAAVRRLARQIAIELGISPPKTKKPPGDAPGGSDSSPPCYGAEAAPEAAPEEGPSEEPGW
ncbi:MAG: hypothetical protein ABSH34_17835 [Verrucomicrobiota bacterium]